MSPSPWYRLSAPVLYQNPDPSMVFRVEEKKWITSLVPEWRFEDLSLQVLSSCPRFPVTAIQVYFVGDFGTPVGYKFGNDEIASFSHE
jgi:hypothetical protein